MQEGCKLFSISIIIIKDFKEWQFKDQNCNKPTIIRFKIWGKTSNSIIISNLNYLSPQITISSHLIIYKVHWIWITVSTYSNNITVLVTFKQEFISHLRHQLPNIKYPPLSINHNRYPSKSQINN
jgi:hypothetical protein